MSQHELYHSTNTVLYLIVLPPAPTADTTTTLTSANCSSWRTSVRTLAVSLRRVVGDKSGIPMTMMTILATVARRAVHTELCSNASPFCTEHTSEEFTLYGVLAKACRWICGWDGCAATIAEPRTPVDPMRRTDVILKFEWIIGWVECLMCFW